MSESPQLLRRKVYLFHFGRQFYKVAGRWVNAEEQYLITDPDTITALDEALSKPHRRTKDGEIE